MRFLEVIDDRPPNFAAIAQVFPDAFKPGVIFAYGGKIYAPGRKALTPALQAHEQVHIARQGENTDAWWDRYLADPAFRLEEELIAHRAEYQAYCRRHTEPGKRHAALKRMAERLASPLYGGLITPEEAVRRIMVK